MLILKENNEINQQTAHYLQANHLDSDTTKYFIVDIEQHYFKKNITPEKFVAQLIQSKLPDSIQDIYLLTSEIEADHFLAIFSHHVSRIFSEKYKRKITVHVPTYLSCDMTLIVPDKEKNSWKVYGINRSDLTADEKSFDKLLLTKNKKSVWEGQDLLEWMNDPQHAYQGISYAWGNV